MKSETRAHQRHHASRSHHRIIASCMHTSATLCMSWPLRLPELARSQSFTARSFSRSIEPVSSLFTPLESSARHKPFSFRSLLHHTGPPGDIGLHRGLPFGHRSLQAVKARGRPLHRRTQVRSAGVPAGPYYLPTCSLPETGSGDHCETPPCWPSSSCRHAQIGLRIDADRNRAGAPRIPSCHVQEVLRWKVRVD